MSTQTLRHNAAVLLAGVLLLAAVTWVVAQANILPVLPDRYVAMWGVILSSLGLLVIYWAGAMGLGVAGQWLLLRRIEPVSLPAAGLGLALMLLASWLIAWTGALNRVTAWLLPLVGALLWLTACLRHRQAFNVRFSWGLLLLVPGLGLLLVAAACPPGTLWRTEAFGYDVLSYHLQVPREWMAAGAMQGLEHNVYSYLPGLFEAGYLHVGHMHRSMRDAVYTCQLLHVSAAVLAAAGVGGVVARFGGRAARFAAAGVLLAVPWIMVTGSLAYNEMAALAFGAVALALVYAGSPALDSSTKSEADGRAAACRGAAVGLLCGAATLCKLTAGPMLAVPIGVVMLMRREYRPALLAAVVGFATLCPYFARNAVWTGNPVFPFATAVFGQGHWDGELTARWQRGHSQAQDERGDRRQAIQRQWLFNTGYGAIGGQPVPREVRNIARFRTEGGVPVLWIAVALAAVIVMWRCTHRAIVAQMAVMMTIQVTFWLVATHLQSRFLIPTILPATVIVGLGFVELQRMATASLQPWLFALVPALLAVLGFTTLLEQTMTGRDPQTGERFHFLPAAIVDSLDLFAEQSINHLPSRGVKVYLVADNSRLFYLDRPIVYHSAFDANPLGELIRREPGPAQVTAALRAMGVTHVWVHWQELDRLHNTYGFDRDVTGASLGELAASGWRVVEDVPGVATLYALPRE